MRLSRKRERWARSRRNATLVGKPLKPSAAVAIRYDREMGRLVTQMAREYEREIRRLYKREAGVTLDSNFGSQARILMNRLGRFWGGRFIKASNTMVDRLVKQVDRTAGAQLKSSLEDLAGLTSIKVPKLPGDLSDKLAASIAENVSLIRSIPEQYHFKVSGTLLRSVEGSGWSDQEQVYKLAMETIERTGIDTHKRASLIARTETAKISAEIQSERMKSVGVTKFRWVHSGGSAEPRQLHVGYSGQIFDIDDPPIIDERTGQRGMPGTIWNCSCFAVPVIEFDNGEAL